MTTEILYHLAFANAVALLDLRRQKHVEQFDWKDGLSLPPHQSVRVTVEIVDEAVAMRLEMEAEVAGAV